ncbi:response regulator transcription factor [Alishewanella sp. d11]|uniref:response regulator transcription factor n=1 Tax=Alishewanella sp. d11 TaxID=3414030 RepID=UPI003BF8751E
MEKNVVKPYNQLYILSDNNNNCNLVFLAKSLNINVSQLSASEFQAQQSIPSNTLIGIQVKSVISGKSSFNNLLQAVKKCGSVFLFNAERGTIDTSLAINTGLRGIIYRDEQLDRVLSALSNMMKGQLYYSRNELSSFVDRTLAPEESEECLITSEKFLLLTKQEKRITKLIAEGARNKEIADQLNISTHTVKAHISTILRKTQSRNRIELLKITQMDAVSPQTYHA